MYYLSIGAVFRNESDSIVEWIKHYLHHGVDHFYLINDNSDDDTVSKIQDYIDKGIITLYHSSESYYLGRQIIAYNKFLLPHVNQKDTQWLMMIDMDEYVWSPLHLHLGTILQTYCGHLGQVQMIQYVFGSNGHVEQPESLVSHFTKRAHEPIHCLKYFVNTDFEFSSLNIHHASFMDPSHFTDGSFVILSPEVIAMNHYSCQSVEFWQKVKCTRGDGDAYLQRDMARFHELDKNELEDRRLVEQNKDIE